MPLRPMTPTPAAPVLGGAVESIREWLQTFPAKDLAQVLNAGLLVPLAEEELASRGLDRSADWVGFDRADAIWRTIPEPGER